jgi:hypothetical protein
MNDSDLYFTAILLLINLAVGIGIGGVMILLIESGHPVLGIITMMALLVLWIIGMIGSIILDDA